MILLNLAANKLCNNLHTILKSNCESLKPCCLIITHSSHGKIIRIEQKRTLEVLYFLHLGTIFHSLEINMKHYLNTGHNLSMGHYYFTSTKTVALFVCIPSHYKQHKQTSLTNLILQSYWYVSWLQLLSCESYSWSVAYIIESSSSVSQLFYLGVHFI